MPISDEQFNNLERKVLELESKFRDSQLKYPLDSVSKKIIQDAVIMDRVIILEANSTPVAVTNSGKIFALSDNSLYFQDGDGITHHIFLTT